ncbi:MAG: hypothetical protein J3K34DRAFT_422247 [Monoraphidium minutum]|nr:MAG: hypothetical protein J3K34DRAFT_422247 [Monoraphidium minutum]
MCQALCVAPMGLCRVIHDVGACTTCVECAPHWPPCAEPHTKSKRTAGRWVIPSVRHPCSPKCLATDCVGPAGAAAAAAATAAQRHQGLARRRGGAA